MMKLTRTQKILRPVINWLVETFFDNGCFLGNGYIKQFEELDFNQVKGYSCASYLINLAVYTNATELSVSTYGLSISGKDIGDWQVTVENVKHGADFPKKHNSSITKVSETLDMETGEKKVEVERKDKV